MSSGDERQRMNPLPPVSVVIPTRARPQELLRAVRSVYDQDYAGSIEVVVVVMGPEVRPPAPTADDRFLKLVTKHRPWTPGAARNEGVAHASHELIAFLDDDDYFLPAKLRVQVEWLGTFDAVFTGVRYHADGRVKDYVPSTNGDLIQDAASGAFFAVQSLLTTKHLLSRIGGFDCDMLVAEDQDLIMRMAHAARVGVVPDAMVIVERGHRTRLTLGYENGEAAFRTLQEKHPEVYAARPDALGFAHTRLGWLAFADHRRRTALAHAGAALRRSPRSFSAWCLLVSSLVLPSRALDLALAARWARWKPVSAGKTGVMVDLNLHHEKKSELAERSS